MQQPCIECHPQAAQSRTRVTTTSSCLVWKCEAQVMQVGLGKVCAWPEIYDSEFETWVAMDVAPRWHLSTCSP